MSLPAFLIPYLKFYKYKEKDNEVRSEAELGLVPALCLAYGNVAWRMHFILIMAESNNYPITNFLHNWRVQYIIFFMESDCLDML